MLTEVLYEFEYGWRWQQLVINDGMREIWKKNVSKETYPSYVCLYFGSTMVTVRGCSCSCRGRLSLLIFAVFVSVSWDFFFVSLVLSKKLISVQWKAWMVRIWRNYKSVYSYIEKDGIDRFEGYKREVSVQCFMQQLGICMHFKRFDRLLFSESLTTLTSAFSIRLYVDVIFVIGV